MLKDSECAGGGLSHHMTVWPTIFCSRGTCGGGGGGEQSQLVAAKEDLMTSDGAHLGQVHSGERVDRHWEFG